MTKLDFPSVTWRDAGSYVCLAENAGGRSQKQVEITVLCKFTFLEFYSTSSTLNKLSPCHTPSLLNWCSPYHTTFTHIGLSLQLQPLQFGPCQTAFTLIYLPLSHMHSVTIYLQPQLESSLSHFFHLHMTSPKLYPVLSALSLVVFEYGEVHKLGFQVSFCWSIVSSLYCLQMHLKTQASKLMHHRTPLVMALTLPSLVKPMEILPHNISFTLKVKV